MKKEVAPPRLQQAAILTLVFVLHAALLGLLLQHNATVAREAKQIPVGIVTLDAERPATAKPPPPAAPSKTADTFKPIVEFSTSTEVEPDASAGASGACSTEGEVLDALLLDQAALDAVRESPAELRSVAGAIVVWNEGWNPVALDSNAPLNVVRTNVERTLAKVAPRCLEQPVLGPRLLPVPDASGTTTIFVVIGSGSWTWAMLLEKPAAFIPLATPGIAVTGE